MMMMMCGHVEEILLLNKFFPIVGMCISCKDIARQKLFDGAQMATFWRFFASCISSELRAARFTPASYICTKATPCVEVWQTSNLRPLQLGEEKKKKEEQKTG